MSWSRKLATQALTQAIQAVAGETAFVYPKPPSTLNPPAIVIGRPSGVVYVTAAFSIDEATLPVHCVAAADGDDDVDALIIQLRSAVSANPTLGGVVTVCTVTAERGWRNFNIAGIDVLQADVDLTIQM